MGLKLVKTDGAIEIHHTERIFANIFIVITIPAYCYMAFFIGQLLIGDSSHINDISTHNLLKLVSFEVLMLGSIAATIFYVGYLTTPLIASRNGILQRKFLGIGKISVIGYPMTFEIKEYLYKPPKSYKSFKCFDLYLSGPMGSNLVTVRGKPENYFAIAKLAHIPIHYLQPLTHHSSGTPNGAP